VKAGEATFLPASEPEPAQGSASEKGPEKTPPEPDNSTEPEIPPMLLRMAGYADAEAAKADGLGSPEALNAFKAIATASTIVFCRSLNIISPAVKNQWLSFSETHEG